MGDAPRPPNFLNIIDRATHDTAFAKAQGTPPTRTDAVPTLFYVSSESVPACRVALPKVIALAEANPHVLVYHMELTSEITPLIKFGHQNTPIFIMIHGAWCETVLGPDYRTVEATFRTRFKQPEQQQQGEREEQREEKRELPVRTKA